ncbi:MAG: AmmeMemoRadiSam system protein B, partial [Kiritimatiellae bacterium]|nr:AmmeMemoRadiSam system protein B [Kiritimatiellia bacterium]
MFVVRDTWGLISEPVGLSEEMMVVLGLLSRGLSKRELAVALTRRYGGTIVMDEDVDRLVAKLDDALLLETARVQEARLELVRQWTRTSIRAPALAGQAYPANMHELHKFLDDILRPAVATTKPSGELRALAVPHIDLKVGRRVYAAGYSVMRQCAPQRVLVLGTGHSMGDDLVCLTEKDFETPLGRIETERDAVRRLRTAAGSLAAPDDLAHRREHSIEIQLVFLQHLLPGCNFKLIPVLFGSLEPHLARCAELSAIPGMNELLETLREMAGQPNTLTVAGGDLAQIGPKFGDPLP